MGPLYLWTRWFRVGRIRGRRSASPIGLFRTDQQDVVTMESNTPIGTTPYKEYIPSPHGSGTGALSLEPHDKSLSTANGTSGRSKKELADSVTKIKPRDTKSHTLWLDELEEAFRDGDLFDAYMLETRPMI